jgi:hypothetical protein
MDGRVNYFDGAQRVFEAVNRLLGTAQQMFDAARRRQSPPVRRRVFVAEPTGPGCAVKTR